MGVETYSGSFHVVAPDDGPPELAPEQCSLCGSTDPEWWYGLETATDRPDPARAGVPHQDAGAVSLVGSATLRWCAQRWGVDADARRLRANIVFESAEPFVEETWFGHTIQLGSARLRVVGRVERCRMIDIAQDVVSPAGGWLKPFAVVRDMRLAVYADVTRPGSAAVGDAIQAQ